MMENIFLEKLERAFRGRYMYLCTKAEGLPAHYAISREKVVDIRTEDRGLWPRANLKLEGNLWGYELSVMVRRPPNIYMREENTSTTGGIMIYSQSTRFDNAFMSLDDAKSYVMDRIESDEKTYMDILDIIKKDRESIMALQF